MTLTDGTLLWDVWRRNAERQPEADAVIHWQAGERPIRWSRARLLARAASYGSLLRAHGIRPGDVCALMFRHHPSFYPLYLGVVHAGALPAVLAYPNPRLHPEKFQAGLLGMAAHSGLDWILTERDLEPGVAPAVRPGGPIRGVLFPLEWTELSHHEQPYRGAPSSPCLLQHSSGTTGLQKAVTLSHDMVLGHVRRYAAAIDAAPGDRVASWLPLYHDMGLIAAFHLPLALGIPLVQLDPFEWVVAPALLFQAMAAERATLAWLPNFAYNLMAERIHAEDLEGVRLEHVRLLVNCSEPVRLDAHERFIRRFAALGLKWEALSTCYAMAETTFAVTQAPPGRPPVVLPASRRALARGRYGQAIDPEDLRACVSCGRPIADCRLRIVDEVGNDLPEGSAGEILVASASLFSGYRGNRAATAAVLEGEWYRTGDLGFLLGGECFVIGRKKDVIIVAGNNIYPEDVEDAVNAVPGVIPGRVVAFALDDERYGTESVAVIAETQLRAGAALQGLRRAIVTAAMAADVTLSRVYLAPPRWLLKSSSGKPSRRANAERALHDRSLQVEA